MEKLLPRGGFVHDDGIPSECTVIWSAPHHHQGRNRTECNKVGDGSHAD